MELFELFESLIQIISVSRVLDPLSVVKNK